MGASFMETCSSFVGGERFGGCCTAREGRWESVGNAVNLMSVSRLQHADRALSCQADKVVGNHEVGTGAGLVALFIAGNRTVWLDAVSGGGAVI